MMIGFTVTDQFIAFWKHIDQCADERPWSVLYSERYINKVFTSEKAESLKTMWDEIGGNYLEDRHILILKSSKQVICEVNDDSKSSKPA